MIDTNNEKLDLNEQFLQAYHLMEKTSGHVFVTGKAGTGKSTLLRYFRGHTEKDIVVLASTGVAAVNIKGQTVHSFFNFKPDITPAGVRSIRLRKNKKNLYKNIDAVVIDEISMVRADLLDCVDAFLKLHGPHRTKPFGGVQMIFFGDMYQLPPVVTSRERDVFARENAPDDKRGIYSSPYFFSAKIFEGLPMELIELEKIYRQKDGHFISLLNAIRNNSATEQHLEALNRRLAPDFKPAGDDFYIHLTTTNDLADHVNQERLNALKGKARHYEGTLRGDFDVKSLPTQEELDLKVGAQVMLLNNDREGRWVNGTLGKIVDVQEDSDSADVVRVELADGGEVEVTPFTWEMFRFFYNDETDALDSETVGSFTQYPLRLAWAVTIHKSQGKTFPRVVVDIGRGTFSHGQVYVALSRCTSLPGLVLKKPILKRHILMDWRVVEFMTGWQYRRAEELYPVEEKRRKILEQAIEDEKTVEIVYLKANDEKTRRTIAPRVVGDMEYLGKTYLGVEAYCFARKEIRAFRVDRILEIKECVKEVENAERV